MDEPAQKLLERIVAARNESSLSLPKGTSSTSLRGAKAAKQSKNQPSRIYCENGVWYEQVGTATPKDISDEIPFEIPENWAWCRLEHVCKDIADIDHKMPPVCENGVPYISPLNFKPNNEIDYDGAKKISVDDFKQLSRKCKPERGDIIFPRYGTIGVIRTVKTDIDFLVSYSCATIKPYKEYMNEGYICFLLQSSLIQKIEIPRYINKTTQPNVGLQSIKKFLFALPPLAEQKRIVAKLEQVLPLAEEYGAAQEQLDKLNKELPEALKKSILQEAIQGKLVPQNPKDEPASVLLEKIRKEKQELVEQGKLKKKDLVIDPITKEELSFALPEKWEICRLGDLCYLVDGEKTSLTEILLDAKYLRGKSSAEKIQGGRFVKKGDNIILVDGENSGEVFEVPIDGIMGSTFKQIIVNKTMYKPYVMIQILAYKDLLRNSKKGAAIPHLNKDIFRNLPIGIPPISEQKRIVAKLEQLFKVL